MEIRKKAAAPLYFLAHKRAGWILLSLILPVSILVFWEIFSRMGFINQSILPMPSRLLDSLTEMVQSGRLQKHLLASGGRVVKGFAIGAGAGLAIGVIIGLSKTWSRLLAGLIGILRPIPMMSWVPILILWMGIDEESKVAVIAIGSFWPVLLNTSRGIRSTDKKLLEVGVILEKKPVEMLVKVILLSAFPFIFAGIRLGIGAAWTCVVTAEMIAASMGIGFLIMYARELSQPDVMFVGVFSIGLIGLALDHLLLYTEKKVIRWDEEGGKS